MPGIEERNGTIGIVKGSAKNETFEPKANFRIEVVAKVEGTLDGYIASVSRAPDNTTRLDTPYIDNRLTTMNTHCNGCTVLVYMCLL